MGASLQQGNILGACKLVDWRSDHQNPLKMDAVVPSASVMETEESLKPHRLDTQVHTATNKRS